MVVLDGAFISEIGGQGTYRFMLVPQTNVVLATFVVGSQRHSDRMSVPRLSDFVVKTHNFEQVLSKLLTYFPKDKE